MVTWIDDPMSRWLPVIVTVVPPALGPIVGISLLRLGVCVCEVCEMCEVCESVKPRK